MAPKHSNENLAKGRNRAEKQDGNYVITEIQSTPPPTVVENHQKCLISVFTH